jgi:putative cell wall-binding protein
MKKARKSLALLLTAAMVLTMTPVLAFAAEGAGSQVNRLAGANRYDTSAKTALDAYPDGAETVIIARGDNEGQFADGLAASYLAGLKDAPILLTDPKVLPQETENAIVKLKTKKAYVLGGKLAVSPVVESKLKDLNLEVKRIEGDNRYATAAFIAAEGKADTALVVSGFAPADSLVAGPLASGKGYPILLVNRDSVPDETNQATAGLGIKTINVVGGENVVSKAVYEKLGAKARYSGQSRIETSLAVAKDLFKDPKAFSIVGYLSLADAVGAAVYGDPIIYVKNNLAYVQSYLAGAITANTRFTIFGGSLAVNGTVENALRKLLGEPEQPEQNDDFVITNGVLKEYTGAGGDVVIPYGVTSIGDEAFCIYNYGSGNDITSITIPDSVTSIGEHAFTSCRSLTSITIPDSVKSIGECAFGFCENLKSVIIGDGVTSIGKQAFLECKSLTNVIIPNSVKSIEYGVFQECGNLKSVTIGNSVTSIGDGAFAGCYSLTNVSIPDSVTNIEKYAFSGCKNLTSISIGSGVTSIRDDMFFGCDNLAMINVKTGNSLYSSVNGVLLSKDKSKLIYYPHGKTGVYVIPDNVTSIGNGAFSECDKLTSVIIGNGVTSIGDNAFYHCYGLASVTMPNSLTNIGSEAFESCHSLTNIDIPDSVTSIGERAFLGCVSFTNIVIPDSIKEIKDETFRACYELISITIPDGVTTIGNKAFYQCSKLPSITIPDSVTSIGDEAFSYCRKLKSITIPGSITGIRDKMFYECSDLKSVTISDGVTSIGDSAFAFCNSLTSVTIPDSVTNIGDWVFSYHNKNLTIYGMPGSYAETYATQQGIPFLSK